MQVHYRAGRVRWARVFAPCALLAAVAACSTDKFYADDSEAVVDTATLVAASLIDGDGPGVCAHMYREAQVALMKKYGGSNCITAVSAAGSELGDDMRRALADLDAATVTIDVDVAEVRGTGTKALARALNLPGLWLSQFEGDWTFQGSVADPAVKDRM
jgi:hypothetical protein